MSGIPGLLGLALSLLASPPTATGASEQVSLVEERLDDQDVYRIDGEFEVEASADEVFTVLADYEGLRGVVTSIRESLVKERDLDTAVIEQTVEGRFLFFTKQVRLLLRAHEFPPDCLDFETMSGAPFAYYRGQWRLEESGRGVRVHYLLLVSRGAVAPVFLEKHFFESNARDLLKQLRREVVRRAASSPRSRD